MQGRRVYPGTPKGIGRRGRGMELIGYGSSMHARESRSHLGERALCEKLFASYWSPVNQSAFRTPLDRCSCRFPLHAHIREFNPTLNVSKRLLHTSPSAHSQLGIFPPTSGVSARLGRYLDLSTIPFSNNSSNLRATTFALAKVEGVCSRRYALVVFRRIP